MVALRILLKRTLTGIIHLIPPTLLTERVSRVLVDNGMAQDGDSSEDKFQKSNVCNFGEMQRISSGGLFTPDHNN